jgi:hypothetical protein
VAAAVALLEAERAETRNTEVLDTLIAYFQARQQWIANYRVRRIDQQSIGSGHVQKANDLIVAVGRREAGCSGARRRAMGWPRCGHSC